MADYEYTVIPSPAKAEKAKGQRTSADRFAATLTGVLNDLARQGWEYVRAETLPAEERSGLTGRATVWHNVLIFRRAVAAAATGVEPTEPAPSARPFSEPMRPAEPAPGGGAPER